MSKYWTSFLPEAGTIDTEHGARQYELLRQISLLESQIKNLKETFENNEASLITLALSHWTKKEMDDAQRIYRATENMGLNKMAIKVALLRSPRLKIPKK